MDLDTLETFVCVARLGGFSRAAVALHRSQPAISRRIELLEREVAAPLFERLRGGPLLTDGGRVLLPFAEAALAAARDGAAAVAELQRGDSGQISIALVGTLANDVLTRRLRDFRLDHPRIRLDLRTATSQEVGNLVERGEATMGLRYFADPRPGLTSQTVAEERLIVVCGRDHRLGDGRPRDAGALAGETWVAFPTREPRESFSQFLGRRLASVGLEDADILPIDSLTAQKRMVEAGFGIALLTESGVEEELRAGALKAVDVPALQARIPVSLVVRRNGYLSPAANRLVAMITNPTPPSSPG